MQHLNVLHTGALGEEGRRDMALVCRLYRALNDSTVKNKFPIPIVEELLDGCVGPNSTPSMICVTAITKFACTRPTLRRRHSAPTTTSMSSW
jgi:hypothetical protein